MDYYYRYYVFFFLLLFLFLECTLKCGKTYYSTIPGAAQATYVLRKALRPMPSFKPEQLCFDGVIQRIAIEGALVRF
jgi:hypothetical protein